jgi:hypothetical protein
MLLENTNQTILTTKSCLSKLREEASVGQKASQHEIKTTVHLTNLLIANFIGVSTEYRDAQSRYMINLRIKLRSNEGVEVGDCQDAVLLGRSLQVITVMYLIKMTLH